MRNGVKQVAANVASRMNVVASSYQELFENMLKKYNVTSPNQLTPSQKIEFYNELDSSWNTKKEPGQDGMVKEEAGNIRYNKGEKVLVNKGPSWGNPQFHAGEITRVGKKVSVSINGETETFAPTNSGIGIIGRWNGDVSTDGVKQEDVHMYLDASCQYYGTPFGKHNDSPFFPSNRPDQTMHMGGEGEEDAPQVVDEKVKELEDKEVDNDGSTQTNDGMEKEESSVALNMTCPRCQLKQIWPSTGYCPSCAYFFGYPAANPEGYYTGGGDTLAALDSDNKMTYDITGYLMEAMRQSSYPMSLEQMQQAAQLFEATLKNSILNHASGGEQADGDDEFDINESFTKGLQIPMGVGQFNSPRAAGMGMPDGMRYQQQRPMSEWASVQEQMASVVTAMQDDSVPLMGRIMDATKMLESGYEYMTTEDYAEMQDAYGKLCAVKDRVELRKKVRQ
ncbi:hypothetical protein GR7B_00089 [Vibrio phage vB_VcorM_GR7B]|nr:hypothetical protein GR7B_00089 [Vibrio phage vB_VcorM_GR7B]